MASKRNAHGSGTIRKRSDGRWEARVTTGRDPLTGKHVRKSVYGQSEKDVRKKLTQMTADVDAGTYTEPSKLTVGQWLDIWAAEYLGDVKPGTIDAYKSNIKTNLKPSLSAVKLSALSAHAIQTLYNRLHKGGDDKPGLSPKTIKNLHGVLHKALQQAVELRYIRFNPADACKLPRVEKKEIKPLDDDAITAFLYAIQGHKWEAVYLVTLFTGVRQGEILGLAWSRVDFKSGIITVDRQQLKKRVDGKYPLAATKNDKSRRITPAPSVMAALWEQRRRQAEMQLKAGQAWSNEDNLVFTDELGSGLCAQTVYDHYKRIVAKIGIPESRFHDLRHSYAVAALQSGDDIKTVQQNLGHHTASFTLDTYGHVTEKMKQDSAARMEQFIKKRKAK